MRLNKSTVSVISEMLACMNIVIYYLNTVMYEDMVIL